MDDVAVRFKDLEFGDYFFRWGRHSLNEASRYHWVPIGMPRIGKRFPRSAFYLFPHDKDQFNDQEKPQGTGVFVAISSKAAYPLSHIYAVSNSHVVKNSPCIQVNRTGGGARKLNLEFDDWVESPDEDLAIADVTDHLGFDEKTLSWLDDFSWVSEDSFISKSRSRDLLGYDTFMIGLFDNHRIRDRNIPVARFGNISAVPNDHAPVRLLDNDNYLSPAYLNDMRSRTGFSGSPVWVWTAASVLDESQKDRFTDESIVLVKPFVSFLGIHRGQIPEDISIKQADGTTTATIKIPSAMTVVIPAWKISEVIDSDQFAKQRKDRDHREDRVNLVRRLHDMMRAREILPHSFVTP